MGAFRHSSTRGEKRGERGLARDEGEEKGGLRKVRPSSLVSCRPLEHRADA